MNKFERISPELTTHVFQSAQGPVIIEGLFDGGLVLNKSPQDLQPNQSPDLGNVRLERGGLRQDYGQTILGVAAPNRVLAIGEHKYISSGVQIERVFRIFRDASGLAEIESWSGTTWEDEIVAGGTGTLELEDVLVSFKSILNEAFFADGERVLRWIHEATPTGQTDNFTVDNELVLEGDEVDATITPAAAVNGNYEVFGKLTVTGPAGPLSKVDLEVEHDGEIVGQSAIGVAPSTDSNRTYTHLDFKIPFNSVIASGETLTVRLKDVNVIPVVRTNTIFIDSGVPLYKGNRSPTVRKSYDNNYSIKFTLEGIIHPTASTYLSFYKKVAGVWTQVGDNQPYGAPGNYTFTFNDTDDIEAFGINFFSNDPGYQLANTRAEWGEGFDVSVHMYDGVGDNHAGVVYQSAGTPTSDIEEVEKDPENPGSLLVARYLGVFANRLVALQVDGDPQKIAWSIFGDTTDWVGDGSGEVIRESKSVDSIDPLMALEPLSSDVGALFRQFSIERVVRTGVLEPSLAFYPWIENIGTKSPFSVKPVPGGIAFFGTDYEVYYLTESGPRAIGAEIRDELMTLIGLNPSQLVYVNGVYDPVEHNYILSVPSGNAGTSTEVSFIFDMEEFLKTGVTKWHRRPLSMDALAVINGVDIYFSAPDRFVRKLDRDSLIAGGYWGSPMLNQGDRFADFTLTRVGVKYEADGDTELVIQGSGNGGETIEEGFKGTVPLFQTQSQVRRAFQGFNITGPDLRFRISYPSDYKVLLRGWTAELVKRSRQGQYVRPSSQSEGLVAWWSAHPSRRIAYQDLEKTITVDEGGDQLRVWEDSVNGWDARLVNNAEPDAPSLLAMNSPDELGFEFGVSEGHLTCVESDLINAVSGNDRPFWIMIVYQTSVTVSPNREVCGFWGPAGMGNNPRHQIHSNNSLFMVTRRSDGGQSKNATIPSPILGQNTYLRVLRFTGTTVSEWINGTAAYLEEDLDVASCTFSQFIINPYLGKVAEILIGLGDLSDAERTTYQDQFALEYTLQAWSP